MNCRKKLKKYLRNGESRYTPINHNLVTVFDMQKMEYRTIPLESIRRILMDGIEYRVI